MDDSKTADSYESWQESRVLEEMENYAATGMFSWEVDEL